MEKLFIEHGYTDIKKEDARIEAFCNDDKEWMPELKYIYLHKTYSEMYLIINIGNLSDSKHISETIKEWEIRILEYLNFEFKNEGKKQFLMYNITLILLCVSYSSQELDDREHIIKEEKSTNICRKIFLFCDKDYNLKKEELKYLPFNLKSLILDEEIMKERVQKKEELNALMKEAVEYLKELEEEKQEECND